MFGFREPHCDEDMSWASPYAILLAALAVDAVLGDPPALYRRVPHPVAAIGALVARLERALYGGDTPTALRRRGAILVLAVLAVSLGAGQALVLLLDTVGSGWAFAGEVLVAATLLATRDLHDRVHDVAHALGQGDTAAARNAIGHLVGRDPDSLDEAGLARAAIESLAENFADAVAAPAFWYLVLGLPGMIACKAINTMDSMLGHRTARYCDFGLVAARLDDAANFVPARLAAVLLTLAAIAVPGARSPAALRVMGRDAPKHRSPNAGWPEAAMSGALGLALGGPRRYAGVWTENAWLGDGRQRANEDDIARALALYRVATGLLAAGLAVVALSTHG